MQERNRKKKTLSFQAEFAFFPTKKTLCYLTVFQLNIPQGHFLHTKHVQFYGPGYERKKAPPCNNSLYQPTNPHSGAIIPCSLSIRAKG